MKLPWSIGERKLCQQKGEPKEKGKSKGRREKDQKRKKVSSSEEEEKDCLTTDNSEMVVIYVWIANNLFMMHQLDMYYQFARSLATMLVTDLTLMITIILFVISEDQIYQKQNEITWFQSLIVYLNWLTLKTGWLINKNGYLGMFYGIFWLYPVLPTPTFFFCLPKFVNLRGFTYIRLSLYERGGVCHLILLISYK